MRTRLQILQKLSSRIEDRSKANSVLWLHGSAGVGKSAIAQHLAEKYARSGKLGAAFFFSRSDSSRDKIRPLAASIAYQFCKPGTPFCTTLGPAIIDTIRSDPNIFHTSCENQVQQLLVELSCNLRTVATKEQGSPPYLIVIDGLDECINRPEQGRVLAIVQALISHSASYFSWIILLCSRPEPQIRHGFNHHGFIGHLEVFDVNSLDSVNRDIRRYLVDNFATLRTKYRHALGQGKSTWPGEDVVGKLVARADGQFIFAATVIKYLDVDDEPPQDRLDTILRIHVVQGESPYSPLDMLYHQVLSSCHKWDKVQPLLRLLVTPHHTLINLTPYDEYLNKSNPEPPFKQWRSFETLALLLNFQVHEVSTLLIRLHSVLRIPEGINQEQDILFAHATFPEFLADLNRSGNFHAPAMSESEYCEFVATRLLRTLVAFIPSYPLYYSQPFNMAKSSWAQELQSANWFVRFACQSWDYYCSKVISPSEDLLRELENTDPHVIVAISVELDAGLPLDWALGDPRIDVLAGKLSITMTEMIIWSVEGYSKASSALNNGY
ncbi:hypothetical protein VNI00_012621 [Paramarasmius palmivorus]|uniref:NACHT domain-containing protein n=1 Tax=Paramarasmius palmivorus TaxID=297713 RepID=A0AAW0C3S1_9AGAR